MAALGQTTLIGESRLIHSDTIFKILRGKPSKGKTTNNRSIINLNQTGQAGPSELATTHLQATLQWSVSSLIYASLHANTMSINTMGHQNHVSN